MKMTKAEIDSISNLGLAHMGDCVFEILVRAYLCASGEKTVDKLHRDTIRMVKATSQAEFAEKTDTYAVISIQDSHTGGFGFCFQENQYCKNRDSRNAFRGICF